MTLTSQLMLQDVDLILYGTYSNTRLIHQSQGPAIIDEKRHINPTERHVDHI